MHEEGEAMNTITIDRAVVEQALEALEVATTPLAKDRQEVLRAQAALRAALAQEQAEPVQEPVAKVELMTTGGNAGLATRIVEIDDHLRERLRPGQLLYTAPPRCPNCASLEAQNTELDRKLAELEQAEPVQEEPIGYLWPTGMHPEFRFTQQKRDGVDGTPVYTAPPQRKPLTEEEIYRATGHCGVSKYTAITITRAVERAHGIT